VSRAQAQAPAAVRGLRRQVDGYLEGLVFSRAPSTKLLRDAMRYGLLAGARGWPPTRCSPRR